jgi:hypothetical protein
MCGIWRLNAPETMSNSLQLRQPTVKYSADSCGFNITVLKTTFTRRSGMPESCPALRLDFHFLIVYRIRSQIALF